VNNLHFEWDQNKAASNLVKHGVSFEEAKSVFADSLGRLMADPDNSEDEERFILMGMSSQIIVKELLILFVLFQLEMLINLNENNMRRKVMRESYDFSKSVKNPYAKHFKKQITIRIDEDAIAYFKLMAEKKGIPYQSLINLYLKDCANEHRELEMKWG